MSTLAYQNILMRPIIVYRSQNIFKTKLSLEKIVESTRNVNDNKNIWRNDWFVYENSFDEY